MASRSTGPTAFQFTRPRGARRSWPTARTRTASFNSRAREGRDSRSLITPASPSRFNSRAREGRDAVRAIRRAIDDGFNSRAREGRDSNGLFASVREDVSIHAPARGATKMRFISAARMFSFNSRAREGRDDYAQLAISVAVRFNSRAREGRDMAAMRARRAEIGVSIHAPARGATCQPRLIRASAPCFNSRAREGRDSFFPSSSSIVTCFNSRAREGRDAGARGHLDEA